MPHLKNAVPITLLAGFLLACGGSTETEPAAPAAAAEAQPQAAEAAPAAPPATLSQASQPAPVTYREPAAPAPRRREAVRTTPAEPVYQPAETPVYSEPVYSTPGASPPADIAVSDARTRETVVPPAPPRPGETTYAATSRVEPPMVAAPVYAVLPEGTVLEVRLSNRLSSTDNHSGDTFEAILDRELTVNGQVIAPKGSRVSGELVEVIDSGKVKGRARMELVLRRLHIGDEPFPLVTNPIAIEAEESKERDAAMIGGGAALGAIIGAIAGGKKGAAVGAATGGGAGTAAVLMTKGKAAELSHEQLLSFRLEEPLRVQIQ